MKEFEQTNKKRLLRSDKPQNTYLAIRLKFIFENIAHDFIGFPNLKE